MRFVPDILTRASARPPVGTVARAAGVLTAVTMAISPTACQQFQALSTSSSGTAATTTTTATVRIRSASGVCWTAVVDGSTHRACGNADYASNRTDRQVRVTKTSGNRWEGLSVELVNAAGAIVSRASVIGQGRYVQISGTQASTG
jgi:hypothetical protein